MKLLSALLILTLGLAETALAEPPKGPPLNIPKFPPLFGPPQHGPPPPPPPPVKPKTTAKTTAKTTTKTTTTSVTTTTPAAPLVATTSSSSTTTTTSSSSTTATTTSTTVSASLTTNIAVASQTPLAYSSSCNTASDRAEWCGGFSIDTDPIQSWPTTGNVCAYNFVITNTTLSFDGVPKMVMAVNGQVPGPLIECNWGDTISVTVTNNLSNNGTSIHWHGMRQLGSGYADGVPGIVECPIAPGQSKTYTYTATQYGSSWYHSHYATQYGDGIRGPIIIHGPASSNYDVDMGTVMIDDLFYQTSSQVYAYEAHVGGQNAKNYLLNGNNVSPDLSTGQHTLWQVQSGNKYLFRLVNSAVQNSWWMHIDNHNMTVIAIDNTPITPYVTDWLAIGVGQRYDVIVTANQAVGNYFFRAVCQTACAQNTANVNTGLGSANGILQYAGASTVLPTSSYGKDKTNFATCQDEPISSLVPYIVKPAGSASAFSSSVSTIPGGKVATSQSSDGSVFHWYLNNAAINVNWTDPTIAMLAQGNTSLASNAITLNTANTWAYFVIQNQFLAGHPMHLHGHDFSVLGQGSGTFSASQTSSLNFVNPPRRDTVMLVGSGYTVIGFVTDNPGAWLMHCHIAWHVDGGLALQYIEVPSAIPASMWVASNGFQNQCDNYAAWEAAGGGYRSSSEAGLKVRREYGDLEDGIVRRVDRSEKKYLERYARRDVGDGFKPRHGAHH